MDWEENEISTLKVKSEISQNEIEYFIQSKLLSGSSHKKYSNYDIKVLNDITRYRFVNDSHLV